MLIHKGPNDHHDIKSLRSFKARMTYILDKHIADTSRFTHATFVTHTAVARERNEERSRWGSVVFALDHRFRPSLKLDHSLGVSYLVVRQAVDDLLFL